MKILDQDISDNYAIYHADTIDVAKTLDDNSIHLSVFSPPFEAL